MSPKAPGTALATNANEGMQNLIKVINDLHDAVATTGTQIKLDLPQIAVVGGQSAGKSSVLENIAGRDFLPRGSDIVTRRPLILQMRNSVEEYAEFLHKPGKRFTDYDEVRREIEEETERMVKGKNVSNVPITLKWFSPHVVDLTLVDLPGLTKNPVGDQDPNIVHQIRDMVIEYIQPDNTIILAVSPANQDIANSDAIQVAQLVDTERNRTIGVLTKLDLMDAGTDAREILENRLLPLKKGYIGVVNRSQKDINDKKRIEDALSAEERYFRTHPSYRHMAERMGTKYLQETLNQMLYAHIKERLPGIRARLLEQRRILYDQIAELGGLEANPPSRTTQFTKYLAKFKDFVEKEIYGHRLDVEIHEMSIGVMINQTYYQEISEFLDMSVRPSDHDAILQVMSNLRGVQNALFPAEQAVKMAVGQMVSKYKMPLRQSTDLIARLLRTLVEKAAKQLEDVPKLQEEIVYLVNEKIQEFQEMAKNHLISYVNAEAAFINTKHPDFRYNTADAIRDAVNQGYGSAQQEIADARAARQGNRHSPPPSVAAGTAGTPLTPSKQAAGGANPPKGTTKFYADASHPPRQLFSGMMKAKFHHAGGAGRFSKNRVDKKEFFFVLTTATLSWYKNPKEEDMRGAFNITADVQCRAASDSKGFMRFQFRRSAGGTLQPPDIEIIEVTPIRREDCEIWNSKFGETPMRLERSSSLTSLRSMQLDTTDGGDYAMEAIASETTREKRADWMTELKTDPTTVGWKNTVVAMVEDYMCIVDKTVHDLTPKYLTLFLVDKTVEYVKENLHGDLIGDANVEQREAELLMASGGREKLRKERIEVLKATEHALKILGTFATGGFD